MNDRGVTVLEVAARPIGGLCSRALRFMARGTVRSLEEVLLRHAIGESIVDFHREQCASGVMMIPIPAAASSGDRRCGRRARSSGIEDVVITARPDR